MGMLTNIYRSEAIHICILWLQLKDHDIQIGKSQFPGCYRINFWDKGKLIKSYRVIDDERHKNFFEGC